MKLVILIILLIASPVVFCQTYNMGSSATGTISNACGGTFYDSGGSGGSYGNNQNFTVTFCAPAGQYLYLDFTAFSTEASYDYLYIYNGPSTASPLLSTSSGTGLPNAGNNIYSTLGGCITIRFTSDGSVTGTGWTAAIGCVTSLPTPPPAPGGTSCASANPFCTGTTYSFANNTNQASLGGGGIYGCLGSTPNPVWYFMQIANPGNIDITISQTNNNGNGIDVDFIAWGPFTSVAQGCGALSTNNDVDCSFSTAAVEYLNINNAQTGQFYIVLLTNYSNQAGNITFSQTGGAGSTNCNVLCNMTNFTSVPTACNPATNTYDLNGQITFQYPPTSGTLTVTSSCGGSVSIPQPWVSPISYSLPNLNAAGGNCSVTAAFSADATCQLTTTIAAPAPCNSCVVTASNSGAVCPGGTVNLTSSITGATSYAWTGPGGFTSAVQNPTNVTVPTSPGTYVYTVNVNQGGATCTATTTVTVNPLPTVNAGADDAICLGESVTLTGSGANSYTWDNGATNGGSVSPTATTIYTVTGTDANGCQNTDQITITISPNPVVSAGVDQSVCQGGSVTLSGSGATSYTWDNGVSNGTSFSPSTTMTYTVTGTDGNGCQNTDQVIVTVNPIPVVEAGNPIVICAGESVTLTGVGAPTLTWDNGVQNGVAFSPTATATYTLTGIDANNCQSTDIVIVTVNSLPPVSAGNDQAICAGQSITLNGSGASTYVWDNGITDGDVVSPTGTITYTVVGTDANGCENTDQITITIGANPTVFAGNDVSICQGESITLSGGGADTYVWDNGVTNGSTFVPTATTTYQVTGSTSNGCFNTDEITVTVNQLPIVDAGTPQTVCAGEPVVLSGSGATTYTWDNGVQDGVSFSPTTTQNYTVTGTDANNCSATDQVLVTVNQLPAIDAGNPITICAGETVTLTASGAVTFTWDNGITNGVSFAPTATTTYEVTGVDAFGCENTDQVLVTVNANPIVSAGVDQMICIGGSVVLTGSGAVSYVWDNGVQDGVSFSPASTTTYTVTGTDAFGCENTDQVLVTVNTVLPVNAGADVSICIGESVVLTGTGAINYTWDNGVANGVAFSPTTTTTYTLTGSDNNGCQNTDEVVVTVNALPMVAAGIDQAICSGESVILSGSGALTYVWNNGVSNGVSFSPSVTSTYQVTGTDVNGCENTDEVEVIVNALPTVSAGVDQSVCPNSSVVLSGSGIPNVTYNWDNGVQDGFAFVPTSTATYTVTGIDANGCENTDEVDVIIFVLPLVEAGNNETICLGESIVLSGSGAVTYTWDNGVTNSSSFVPTATSSYTVTGTDANGCQNTDVVTVTVNSLPTVFAGNDQTICAGGAIVLNGGGAVSYTWNNGISNGAQFSPSSTLTYTVTGTDVNGCENTDDVLVTVNQLPTVQAGPDQTVCPGSLVTLSGSGTTNVYYTWSNGIQNGVPFQANATTTYTITGLDANGCQNTDQVLVTVTTLPSVDAGVNQTICAGQTIVLSGSGATSYTWDNGVINNQSFAPSITTNYTVTGTDANGCSNTDVVTITVSQIPQVTFVPNVTSGCSPLEVTYTLTSQPGSSYEWLFGDGTYSSVGPNSTHTYTGQGCFDVSLEVTNADGCSGTQFLPNLICLVDLPEASFYPSNSELTTVNSSSTMMNTSQGAIAYVWDFGDNSGLTTETSPSHDFPTNSLTNFEVTLVAFNELGCTDTARVILTMGEEILIYVPNAFTPDGDQYNQEFKPVISNGFDPYDYSFYIYNRWGELIFESHDADFGWPGTFGVGGEICQDGVYTWLIEYKSLLTTKREKLNGSVNLIR